MSPSRGFAKGHFKKYINEAGQRDWDKNLGLKGENQKIGFVYIGH